MEIKLQNEHSDRVTRSKPLSDVNRTEMIAEVATTDSMVALAVLKVIPIMTLSVKSCQ